MLLSIRFKIRTPKTPGITTAVLYCRLTVNGIPATDFTTGVRVTPKKWDSKNQRILGSGRQENADNERLSQIRADLLELHNLTRRGGDVVSAAQLRSLYLQTDEPAPSLLQCFDRALAIRIPKRTTKENFEQAKKQVLWYLESLSRKDVPLHEVSAEWLIGLQKFLLGRMKPSSLNIYNAYLRAALEYAFNEGFTKKNLAATIQTLDSQDKELIFLEEELVSKIEEMDLIPSLRRVADCFLVQCWSGLSYTDLKSFRPATHVRLSVNKNPIIWFQRNKTAKPFIIPVFPTLARLIEKYPDGFPLIDLNNYNLLIRVVGEMAKCPNPEKLTSHVGRKTAGMYLINHDVPIETVSAILGHSNVATTERTYAKVLTAKIERNTAHLMGTQVHKDVSNYPIRKP